MGKLQEEQEDRQGCVCVCEWDSSTVMIMAKGKAREVGSRIF